MNTTPENSGYQKAEQLIEEAQDRKLTAIDLSNLGLTKVPETIGSLTDVKFICLENNKLTEIPATIGYLPNLLKIYLKNNPLNPVLAAAYNEGNEAVVGYLRALSDNDCLKS